MKILVLAVAASAALLGMAHAEEWTSPKGDVVVQTPPGFEAQLMSSAGDAVSQAVVGTAEQECWFYGIPRPEWASAKPSDVRRTFATPLQQDQIVGMIQEMPEGKPVTALTQAGVEQVKGWPVQVATLSGGEAPTIAAIHARPGLEVRAICRAFDGQDHAEELRQLALSYSHPNDAAWQAQVADWEAQKAAAAAPAESEAKKN